MFQLEGITTILLDIEGTVCPISFVKEVLYPYATNLLPSILARDWNDPIFALYKDAFPAHALATQEALISHVNDLVARDIKDSALKKLQGYLWRIGYSKGELSTPLFADVVPVLRKWVEEQGLKVAIFSSGSVEAQRMFFSCVRVSSSSESDHSSSRNGAASAGAEVETGAGAGAERTKDREGDTKMSTDDPKDQSNEPVSATTTNANPSTPKTCTNGHGTKKAQKQAYEDIADLFIANYDTQNAGPKMQTSSYVRICMELKVDADCVLFLSDSVQEVRAARDAGLKTFIVDRPGNAPLSEDDGKKFGVVRSLDEIEFVNVSSVNMKAKAKEQEPKPDAESKLEVEVEAEGAKKPVRGVKPKSKAKPKGKRKRGPDEGAKTREVRRSKRLNRG